MAVFIATRSYSYVRSSYHTKVPRIYNQYTSFTFQRARPGPASILLSIYHLALVWGWIGRVVPDWLPYEILEVDQRYFLALVVWSFSLIGPFVWVFNVQATCITTVKNRAHG